MTTIVLDAMGVIFSVRDDVRELLCPFVAEKGGSRDGDRVSRLYRAASLGKLSAKEFWRAVFVDPELEEEYLARHRLTDGLMTLLQTRHLRGYPMWCLPNEVSDWSRKLRERFGLAQFIRGFLISGDVGVRKPDRAVFEHLMRRSGATPDEITFVDDNLANLDAAAMLGIQPILFNGNHQREGRRHSAVDNRKDLMNVVLAADNLEGG